MKGTGLNFYCLRYKRSDLEYNTICTFFCYDTNEQSVIERFVDLTKYQKKDIISVEVQNNGSFR